MDVMSGNISIVYGSKCIEAGLISTLDRFLNLSLSLARAGRFVLEGSASLLQAGGALVTIPPSSLPAFPYSRSPYKSLRVSCNGF